VAIGARPAVIKKKQTLLQFAQTGDKSKGTLLNQDISYDPKSWAWVHKTFLMNIFNKICYQSSFNVAHTRFCYDLKLPSTRSLAKFSGS